MKLKVSDIVCFVGRLCVGGVLLYAGFMKAVGPSAEFAAILQAYKLFPASFISPMALAVPYIEMWVGLFVLTGLYTRQAAFLAALLFAVFLTVLSSSLARGIDLVSCGCFGADAFSPRHTLLLDALLLVLSIVIYKQTKLTPPCSLDRTIP